MNKLKIQLLKKSFRKKEFSFRLEGNSMFPIIKNSDKITIAYVPYLNLKSGDIILFEKENKLILHRIIKKNKSSVITKGDNMVFLDKEINKKDILGKVIKLNNQKITKSKKKFFYILIFVVAIIAKYLDWVTSKIKFINSPLILLIKKLNLLLIK